MQLPEINIFNSVKTMLVLRMGLELFLGW